MTKETYIITYPKDDGYTLTSVEALIGPYRNRRVEYTPEEVDEGNLEETTTLKRLVEDDEAITAEIYFTGNYYDIDINLYAVMDGRDLPYQRIVHEE